MTRTPQASRPHVAFGGTDLTGTGPDGGVVPHAVARLVAEFPGRHAAVVCATVTTCRRDLAGAPPGALPELLERLARQRLRDSA
jgi:delta 1-pyrroline-5-carboxylate dehydrogenase